MIDVSPISGGLGFQGPVTMSQAAWDAAIGSDNLWHCQEDRDTHLADMLWSVNQAVRRARCRSTSIQVRTPSCFPVQKRGSMLPLKATVTRIEGEPPQVHISLPEE
jgi:hypothetical protein